MNKNHAEVLTYPRIGATPENTFTQETFDRLTAHLLSWQQSPGAIGGLHLHPCWSETSSIARRYQGQSTWSSQWLMNGALVLHARTGGKRWALLAHDIVSNLLFLQAPDGGFIHAASEFEPAYTSSETCPIHQGMPLLAMLQYAQWSGARDDLREEIRCSIDAHWAWFQGSWWMAGNQWQKPLRLAGWCGVTNQDLTIVAALALYGSVFGDWTRYEQVGRPVLDAYLSPVYYHEEMGLFERGDKANFVERTNYYDIIIDMFEIIHEATRDERLPRAIANVAGAFERAAYVGADGLTHLAWGAETDPDDKSCVTGWIKEPRTIAAYPAVLGSLRRNPQGGSADLIRALEMTLAAYVYADGTVPCSLGQNPLLSIVPGSDVIRWWRFLIDYLGENLRPPSHQAVPRVQRSLGNLTWSAGPRFWQISENGARLYAGIKNNPSGIAIGPDEPLAGLEPGDLKDPDFVEILDAHSD
jgi:hypothetical protein